MKRGTFKQRISFELYGEYRENEDGEDEKSGENYRGKEA